MSCKLGNQKPKQKFENLEKLIQLYNNKINKTSFNQFPFIIITFQINIKISKIFNQKINIESIIFETQQFLEKKLICLVIKTFQIEKSEINHF